jgi:hypothetical protein
VVSVLSAKDPAASLATVTASAALLAISPDTGAHFSGNRGSNTVDVVIDEFTDLCWTHYVRLVCRFSAGKRC